MTQTVRNRIRRHIYAAGYSSQQATAGLEYARAHGATDFTEGFRLAISRILYSDAQLASGVRWSAP